MGRGMEWVGRREVRGALREAGKAARAADLRGDFLTRVEAAARAELVRPVPVASGDERAWTVRPALGWSLAAVLVLAVGLAQWLGGPSARAPVVAAVALPAKPEVEGATALDMQYTAQERAVAERVREFERRYLEDGRRRHRSGAELELDRLAQISARLYGEFGVRGE